MSTAGNQRKSQPRVRRCRGRDQSSTSVCTCAALPAAFLSRSQQAESQRQNPSIHPCFTRKARSFSTEKQGRSRAEPGTDDPCTRPRRVVSTERVAAPPPLLVAASFRLSAMGRAASRAGASGCRTPAPILFGFVGCARRWRRENRAWKRFRRVSHRRSEGD
jgi:hypothetical protein